MSRLSRPHGRPPALPVPHRFRPRLLALEARLAPAMIHFTAAGGAWEDPANWQGSVLPGPGDEAIIDSPGVHVTHATANPVTISKLTLAGNASVATTLDFTAGNLSITTALSATTNFTFTLGGSATLTLNALGTYDFTGGSTFRYAGGTIAQSEGTPTLTLTNAALMIGPGGTSAATFAAQGTTALSGQVNPGQTVWARGSSAGGNAAVAVADGTVNDGTILLQSINSNWNSGLNVASGALRNDAGGVIRAAPGTGGGRTVSGNVTNAGLVDVVTDSALYFTAGVFEAAGGAVHGAGSVLNSRLRVTASPALEPTTVIGVEGNSTLLGDNLAGTTLWVRGSNAAGNGTLAVSGGSTNYGTILLQSINSNWITDVTVASGALVNDAGGVIRAALGTGGGRTLHGDVTNVGRIDAPDTVFSLVGGTYEAAGGSLHGPTAVVNGRVRVTSTPTLEPTTTIPVEGNSTLLSDNLAGTTLWVRGSNAAGNAILTLADGTTNYGTILLQSIDSTWNTALSVVGAGTLTNVAGATFQVEAGPGGARTFTGALVNQGTFHLGGTGLTIDGGDLTNLAGGSVEGTGTVTLINGASFFNLGTLRVPAGALTVTGNFANYDDTTHTLAGGSYEITGTFRFDNASLVNNAAAIVLNGQQSAIQTTFGANALTAFAINTAAGSFGLIGGRDLTVNAGFRNAGTLVVGAQCEFRVAGALANFDGTTGTLADGTYVVAGTLRFTGAAISTNAANIVLDRTEEGAVALIVDENGADALTGFAVNLGGFTILGGRDFSDAGYFYDGGTLIVGAGTRFTANGDYTEAGTAVIAAGGTLRVLGALTNFDATTGTLAGGAFRVAGRLQFTGAAVVVNAADLTLDGPTAAVVNESGGDALAGFLTNAATGHFTVLNGTYAIGHAFTNLGTLTAGVGSTLTVSNNFTQTGTLVVAAGATFRAPFRLTDYDVPSGTLGGGTYRIAGTFVFAGANIRILAATLILDGPDARIQNASGVDGLANFASVAASGALMLQNGAVLTTAGAFANAGRVLLAGGSLTVTGDYTQSRGASTTLAGGTLTAGTVMNGAGATLAGSGTIAANVVNAGLLRVGGTGTAAVLVVAGDFTQMGGTIELHIGLGASGSDYDQLQIGGMATLGGTLNVLAPDAFAPSLGDGFDAITYGGLVPSQFDTTMLPDLGVELYLAVVYGSDRLTLQTSS